MVQLTEHTERFDGLDESEEALTERVRTQSRRLQAVLDRLGGSSGAVLDPVLLRQVVDVINGGVLAAADAYHGMLDARWHEEGYMTACSTSCWASDLHCPTSEPLPPMVDELRALGFGTYHDEVEERVAGETRCVCGDAMGYMGLQRGREIKAWAFCQACGHWLAL